MSHEVMIIADSVSPAGHRLPTFQLRYPMRIHWDFLTHRALSRNASSGRAISVDRMIGMVREHPFIPARWTADATGMRAGEPLGEDSSALANEVWMDAMEDAIDHARRLESIGVHRQDANALLVPFGHIHVLASGTDWDNFFNLRCDRSARPEFVALARDMARAYRDGSPRHAPASVGRGERPAHWHLPYVTEHEMAVHPLEVLRKLSVARCARVSYRMHDGMPPDPLKDVELHDRLMRDGHWSPFEHQACVSLGHDRPANFAGWCQYRSLVQPTVEPFGFASLEA